MYTKVDISLLAPAKLSVFLTSSFKFSNLKLLSTLKAFCGRVHHNFTKLEISLSLVTLLIKSN